MCRYRKKPFDFKLDGRAISRYTIEVVGYDADTGRETSASIDLFIINLRGSR